MKALEENVKCKGCMLFHNKPFFAFGCERSKHDPFLVTIWLHINITYLCKPNYWLLRDSTGVFQAVALAL